MSIVGKLNPDPGNPDLMTWLYEIIGDIGDILEYVTEQYDIHVHLGQKAMQSHLLTTFDFKWWMMMMDSVFTYLTSESPDGADKTA